MVTLIVAGLLVLQFHRELFPLPAREVSTADQELIAEIQFLQDSLDDRQSSYGRASTSKYSDKELPEPFVFDPNQLDSAGFVALGFSPKQSASILKYRAR